MAETKEKKYIIDNSALMAEWDWEKNNELGLNPNALTTGSNKYAWWICSKHGVSWKSTINNRRNGDVGCELCKREKIKAKRLFSERENSVGERFPELCSEWDYKKNNFDIFHTSFASNQKVWWVCPLGHNYEAVVSSRTMGKSGCPYCSGRTAIRGKNDLLTLKPELCEEWNYSKNTISPYQVTCNSGKKVWWICKKGHEWQSTVSNRVKGSGCPYCSGESQTSFPEQAIFYYFSKVTNTTNRYKHNGKIEIDIFLDELNIGIEYDGMLYHSNEMAAQRELAKDSTLACDGITIFRVKETKDKTDITDNIIFCEVDSSYKYMEFAIRNLLHMINAVSGSNFQIDIDIERDRTAIYAQYVSSIKNRSLAVLCVEIAKEWNYERNYPLTPENVSYASRKSVWWKCSKGHEWKAVVCNRTISNTSCPYCSGRQSIVGKNDFATVHPHLLEFWDFEKNDILPQNVSSSSGKKVWWRCPEKHSYQATIYDKVNGSNCPYCSGRAVLKGFNDFATLRPEVALEWHPTKNEKLLPTEVTLHSNRKIWWICSTCGTEWQTSVHNRAIGHSCPKCRVEKQKQNANQNRLKKNGSLADTHPLLISEWDFEKNTMLPTEIVAGSAKKAWWKCSKCGHEWQAVIHTRSKGVGCPNCYREKRRK